MWTGEARFHCERTDEDPRGDPQEPELDDWPDRDHRERQPGQRTVRAIAGCYCTECIVARIRNSAIANARAQAASVENPITREELRESLAVAEAARLEMEASRELAEEERINRIIVAREGSL